MAVPVLSVVFKNESGFADKDVHVGFIGGTLSARDAATGTAIQLNQYGAAHWYALDTLRKGIGLQSYIGGRVYFCYGKPWDMPRQGYEPSSSNPNDPNYHCRYDKMELTYKGSEWDVADTTAIDYFSIPMALNVYKGGVSGTRVGSVTGATTKAMVDALRGVTAKPGAAIVNDPQGAFVRVIGPGAYPPAPGKPESPYDDFQSYLEYLRDTYAPAHSGVVARIKGRFGGVGEAPVTPETKPQDYDFTASIDTKLAITITGSGTLVGRHTLKLEKDDLIAPAGIYGANPLFSLDGAKKINPQNDIYGWLIGDLLSGLNIGAVGSTVTLQGRPVPVGAMNSQDWFKLTSFFGDLQPGRAHNYNRWAAALAPISQAYNFAYSDRFAHVVATLNTGKPVFVDTLEIVLLPER